MCQVHVTRAVLKNIPKRDLHEIADMLQEANDNEKRLQGFAAELAARGYLKAATIIERFLLGFLNYTAFPKEH